MILQMDDTASDEEKLEEEEDEDGKHVYRAAGTGGGATYVYSSLSWEISLLKRLCIRDTLSNVQGCGQFKSYMPTQV